jgi:hypothetical protein
MTSEERFAKAKNQAWKITQGVIDERTHGFGLEGKVVFHGFGLDGEVVFHESDIELLDRRIAAALTEAEERGREEGRDPVVPELYALVKEMKEYLDHGHGTSIGCDSIFHSQMRDALKAKLPLIERISEAKFVSMACDINARGGAFVENMRELYHRSKSPASSLEFEQYKKTVEERIAEAEERGRASAQGVPSDEEIEKACYESARDAGAIGDAGAGYIKGFWRAARTFGKSPASVLPSFPSEEELIAEALESASADELPSRYRCFMEGARWMKSRLSPEEKK